MADNYLEFSEVLVLGSPERQSWLEDQLTRVAPWECVKFLVDYPDLDDDDEKGFELEWTPEGHALFFAEENGNAERLAYLVQKYLKRFSPESSWSLTWATRCSKMRPGEFGGGGVLVTANELFWFGVADQVKAARDRFRRLGDHEVRGEHRDHPAGDWEFEVGNSETRLGYWDWVLHKIESEEDDDTGTTTDGGE